MGVYGHGTKAITTTAQKLVTVQAENDGVLIQNQGAVIVYLGGPTVTADQTATGGYQVPASSSVLVPSLGGYTHDLYAIAATGTATVGWLQPLV